MKSIQDKEKKKDDDMDMEITWVPGITVGQRYGYTICRNSSMDVCGRDTVSIFLLISFVIRTKGNDWEVGEEENGGQRSADTMGGIFGKEEREEEREKKGNEGKCEEIGNLLGFFSFLLLHILSTLKVFVWMSNVSEIV